MSSHRLAYVTQWFAPEVQAVPLWIAHEMRHQGFDVRVVTGVPHYPSGTPMPGYTATRWAVESVEGFRTMRVPEYPSHDRSALRRLATFGSFALSSSLLAARALAQSDVNLVYSSPATSALPALLARKRHGTPYVLMIQDLWPDSIFATGFLTTGPVRAAAELAVGAFVDSSYRAASHICVITPGMKATLVRRGVPEDRITVVYNWVDETVLHPTVGDGELRSRLGLSGSDFVLLYAGNLGEAQGLMSWIEAMALLPDLPDTHLVLLGDGTQQHRLTAAAGRLGVADRVHWMPGVQLSEISRLTADSDVSVISLANRDLFRITMPSKVQASLAMARPVIASAAGDVAEVVRLSGAGWVAEPEDSASIAGAIRAAAASGDEELRQRGAAGLGFFREHMARAVGGARLSGVLRRAEVGSGPPPAPSCRFLFQQSCPAPRDEGAEVRSPCPVPESPYAIQSFPC